ncbi:MAG: hypothetical protein ACTHU0_18080, partial [Kofleriaceae bacterium]
MSDDLKRAADPAFPTSPGHDTERSVARTATGVALPSTTPPELPSAGADLPTLAGAPLPPSTPPVVPPAPRPGPLPAAVDPGVGSTLRLRRPGAPSGHPATPAARYELGPEIARGGMGRVVEATDTLLGRTVALKEVL